MATAMTLQGFRSSLGYETYAPSFTLRDSTVAAVLGAGEAKTSEGSVQAPFLGVNVSATYGKVDGPYNGVYAYDAANEDQWGTPQQCGDGNVALSGGQCLPLWSKIDDPNFSEYVRAAFNVIWATPQRWCADCDVFFGWMLTQEEWPARIEHERRYFSNPANTAVYPGREVSAYEALIAYAAYLLEHERDPTSFQTQKAPANGAAVILATLQSLAGSGGGSAIETVPVSETESRPEVSIAGREAICAQAGLVYNPATETCVRPLPTECPSGYVRDAAGDCVAVATDTDTETDTEADKDKGDGLPIWIYGVAAVAVIGIGAGVWLAVKG